MVGPLERWRLHVRRGCDAGSASIASYTVAAAVFVLGSTFLLHFVVQPPGAMTNGLEHLQLRTKAEESLALLMGTPGMPTNWDANITNIESIKRLGIVESGTTIRIDSDKFDALARGKLAISSAGNGGVDYEEAKKALGLAGYEFHLRAYPLLSPTSTDPYGLADFGDFRVAYVGDHQGGAPLAHAAAEAGALGGLNIDFTNAHHTSPTGGDVYQDNNGDLRAGLLPNIGALVQQTVIAQGAGTKFDFHRVPASVYAPLFVDGPTPPTYTTALSLSSDGATLGYTKNRELRAIVGKADLTGVLSGARLQWSEWVDTDRGNLSYDCQDYGFVEVSGDGGATWTRLTDTPTLRSQDCLSPTSTPPIAPHGTTFASRTVSDITAACVACRNNAAVLIAFHWVADNDDSIGYGWVVDDVVLDTGALTTPVLRKTFEKPVYDMVIVGSNVDNNAFTPNDVKEAIRDYVDKFGGRVLVTGPATNVEWLDRLFDVGIAGASGGVSTPDKTHPLLTLPNQLDYEPYERGDNWVFASLTEADLFSAIVAEDPLKHVLSVSRTGAWGNGTTQEGSVILSSYLPHTMSVVESRKFFANAITYGKFHHLYLEVGPEIPQGEAVASASRSATMNMYRTGTASYIEMAFLMYVWPGGSTSGTAAAATVPATAPPTVSATAGDGTVTIRWTRPISNGSEEPVEFQIWRGTSPDTTAPADITIPYGAWSSAELSHPDSGLQNGKTYYYTVRLVTAGNVLGTPSQLVSATPIGQPGAPGAPVAQGGFGRVEVTWSAPTQTGGGTIFGYAIWANDTPPDQADFVLVSEVGNVTKFVHSVAHDEPMTYKVQALNAWGWSPMSVTATGSAVMPIDPPTLSVSAGVGPGNLTLTWVAPDTLGQTLQGYRIYNASSEAGPYTQLTYINDPLAITYTDVGRGPSVQQWYKVQGVTEFGDGQMSAAKTATTHAVPAAPTVTHTKTLGVVTLSWTPPASDVPIVRYDVYRGTTSDTATMALLMSVTASPAVDTPPSGTYWYAVKAVSAAGASAFSTAVRP